LPRGVILQWRRWCLNPRYSAGAEGQAVDRGYAAVRFPVHSLFITDDEMMTVQGSQTLLDLYSQAPRTLEHVAPADVSARRIGHFGFFREQFRASLWPQALARLRGFGPTSAPPVT
jgi:predicted alpha/beta hydrolase